MWSLISISCVTGFIGDYLLQLTAPFFGGKTGWGLIPYFKQHGSCESVFIAGGMMTLFYVIYFDIFRFAPNLFYLGLYGILLDLFFRKTMLFKSLVGYYQQLNYFWSGFWGAIPMMLPVLIKTAWQWYLW